MATDIFGNATGRETRVAIVEDDRVVELRIDRGDRGYVGNIYLGRVKRIMPGLQAAFVDIGLGKPGFLYVGDIDRRTLDRAMGKSVDPHGSNGGAIPDTALLLDEDDDGSDEGDSSRSHRQNLPSIERVLKEGQDVMVQVSKDPIGTKGPRLRMSVALPGRYMILTPASQQVGISHRISSESERRRLREVVGNRRPVDVGFIVRTMCEDRSEAMLHQDMDYLIRTWQEVEQKGSQAKAPACLYEEPDLICKTVRDIADTEIHRIIVDDKAMMRDVRDFMNQMMPDLEDRVQYYSGTEPIFDVYGVEDSLNRSLGRKVSLKSGAYLVIDQTEALMAIDINSGSFTSSTKRLEDTTLATNLEAVEEIVYQLRLRNIGGIIVIDFIDMEQEANRQRVFKALEKALVADRSRTKVLKISDFGLVEMTRKRTQEGLDRYFHEDCPTCNGAGFVRSGATIVFEVLRTVRRRVAESHAETQEIFVRCAPRVADLIYNDYYDDLLTMEASTGKRVVVMPVSHFAYDQFTVEPG